MPQGFQLSKALNVTEDHTPLSQTGYSKPEIDQIEDPVDASSNYEITSVPSPYARWHLFDQAFRWVADAATESDGRALEGTTIYHKLVAEALDVGEIIFARDQINTKGEFRIEIRSINLQQQVKMLRDSSDDERRNLGETYDLFSAMKKGESDSVSLYDAEQVHMVYVDGVAIGGTSPLSMYFTGADDLSHISIQLHNTTSFDNKYESLIDRESAFIAAQIALVNDNGATVKKFMPGFYEYVNYVNTQLSRRSEHTTIDRDAIDRYVDKAITQDTLFVLKGRTHSIHLYAPGKAGVDSSQLILGTLDGSPVSTDDKRPLVLLPDNQRPCYYYNKVWWDPNVMEGYVGYPENISQRTLPGQHVEYPWLTVSDLLEPTIFRLPAVLDTHRFQKNPGHEHGRNLEAENGDYLFPLKPLFFRFFSWNDLFGQVHGKPMFEMTRTNQDRDVEVILRLPIGTQREFVEIRRKYVKNGELDEKNNKGTVEEIMFNLALIPDLVVARYKEGQVVLQELVAPEYPVDLSFYASWDNTDGESLESVAETAFGPVVRVDPNKYAGQQTKVYHPKERFDMIRVNAGLTGGWIFLNNIPQVDETVSKEFDVAVDFGTTNTHVEIRERPGGGSEALALKDPSLNLRMLFPYHVTPKVNTLRTNLLMRSFYHEIGPDKVYNFPIRTAIAESQATTDDNVIPIARMNIPFYYLNEKSPAPDEIYTNLKWSNLKKETAKSRLHHFISSLLQLTAHEVLTRGGDTSKVRLVYFFPSSMSMAQQGELTKAWKAAYAKYFGSSDGFLQALSESAAPYQFFKYEKKSVWQGLRAINCDIGGGTCDAYINYGSDDKDARIASFRFGGNVVFGDGYDTDKGKNNGFIAACRDAVETKLKEGESADHRSAWDAYQQLMSRSVSSEEVISFYLSLGNRDLHKEVSFNFNDHIGLYKPQMKLVYLVYYAGIIYHLLQVTKSMGLKERPTDITFTGNGSRILQALATDRVLSRIGNLLADEVCGEEVEVADQLRVKTFDKPKDYTSKGGLAMIKGKTHLDTDFSPPANVVVLGTDAALSGKDMYFVDDLGSVQGEAPNYQQLQADPMYKEKTVAQVEEFIDKLFAINDKFSFKSNLEIDIKDIAAAKAEIKRDLEKGYFSGVEERVGEGHPTEIVTETLFFHPLRNVLYNLGRKLAIRPL